VRRTRRAANPGASDFFASPAGLVIGTLSARWSVPTLHAIHAGSTHFNELQRRLCSISHKVLIDTLRSLQRDGFVHGPLTDPAATEYRLTELGVELVGFATDIRRWSEDRSPELARARTAFDEPGPAATVRADQPLAVWANRGMAPG
jgi:DNA-binding HxlR family transcriptional regulator